MDRLINHETYNSFIVPYWWVESFLNYWADEYTTDYISPMFHKYDMWFMPFFIAQVREQILSGTEILSFNMNLGLAGENFSNSLKTQRQFSYFLRSVGSIKLKARNMSTISALPLFKNEMWVTENNETKLKLMLACLDCAPMFLGFINGHGFKSAEQDPQTIFGRDLLLKPPLVIPKSLWYDLSYNERALWLLFKSYELGERTAVGFSGESEIGLWSLLAKLPPSRKSVSKVSQLGMLRNFFQKLRKHAELGSISSSYLALDKMQDILIVYRQSSLCAAEYRSNVEKVAQFYFWQALKDFRSKSEYLSRVEGLKEILAIFENSEKEFRHDFLLMQNQIVLLPIIFLELKTLQTLGDPELFKNYHEAEEMNFLRQKGVTFDQYEVFKNYIQQRKDQEKFIAELLVKRQEGFRQLTVKPTEKQSVTSDRVVESMASKNEALREQILNNLKSLKKNAADKYVYLADNYMNTLDQRSRGLLVAVKEKMQPHVFEEHMQRRLAEYILTDTSRFSAYLH